MDSAVAGPIAGQPARRFFRPLVGATYCYLAGAVRSGSSLSVVNRVLLINSPLDLGNSKLGGGLAEALPRELGTQVHELSLVIVSARTP